MDANRFTIQEPGIETVRDEQREAEIMRRFTVEMHKQSRERPPLAAGFGPMAGPRPRMR